MPGPVDIVDIFRNSAAALDWYARRIRLKDKLGIKVIWMQLGVRNDAAAAEAEAAGLKVVMNRCPKIEYGRLSGEIGWAGVSFGTLSSKRPLLGGHERAEPRHRPQAVARLLCRDPRRTRKTAAREMGHRRRIFRLQARDALGNRGHGVDAADALACAPDIAPRLGLGVAARAEAHLASCRPPAGPRGRGPAAAMLRFR